eukprot:13309636-Alexandrium_andersonii.AAC.1
MVDLRGAIVTHGVPSLPSPTPSEECGRLLDPTVVLGHVTDWSRRSKQLRDLITDPPPKGVTSCGVSLSDFLYHFWDLEKVENVRAIYPDKLTNAIPKGPSRGREGIPSLTLPGRELP